MNPPALPDDEAERLQLLRRLRILDTPAEREFDAIARLAAAGTGSPIAALTFIDAERQWFKAAVGIATRQMPRAESFCADTIRSAGGLVVSDAALDPRYAGLAIVAQPPHVRAYAGMPVVAPRD